MCTGHWHGDRTLWKCAISEDDCDRNVRNWVSASDVIDAHMFKDCRLCPYEENLLAGGISIASDSQRIEKVSENSEQSASMSTVGLVGISVGSVVAVSIFFSLIYHYSKKDEFNEATPPTLNNFA